MEFVWRKGRSPKSSGEYLITVKEDDKLFTVVTDIYSKFQDRWENFNSEEIVAHAPFPKPYRTRNRKK